MGQNIILATSEYQNEASTLVQSCEGLVLTLCSVPMSCSVEIWAYKATVWHPSSSEEDLITSSYTDVERGLLETGAFTYKNDLPIGTYVAVLPYAYYISEAEVLSYTAEILRAHGNYVIIMSSSTYSNGNGNTSNNEKSTTSAIVKGIEKDLGIDLEVSSDSELNLILQKNGAGPLSGLLRMAYGAEKKKT